MLNFVDVLCLKTEKIKNIKAMQHSPFWKLSKFAAWQFHATCLQVIFLDGGVVTLFIYNRKIFPSRKVANFCFDIIFCFKVLQMAVIARLLIEVLVIVFKLCQYFSLFIKNLPMLHSKMFCCSKNRRATNFGSQQKPSTCAKVYCLTG